MIVRPPLSALVSLHLFRWQTYLLILAIIMLNLLVAVLSTAHGEVRAVAKTDFSSGCVVGGYRLCVQMRDLPAECEGTCVPPSHMVRPISVNRSIRSAHVLVSRFTKTARRSSISRERG